MTITFKILLDKRRANNMQCYPLRVRVYQDDSYKQHSLKTFIPEADWDEINSVVLSTNPNYQSYNAKISAIISKVQKLILLSELEERTLSPEDIIDNLKNNPNKVKNTKEPPSIIEYGTQLIKKLETAGKVGNATVYNTAVNRLKSFGGKDKLSFKEVNFTFLENLQTELLSNEIKVNSISNYMRTIRAIFNKAIKEKIIPLEIYPFNEFKFGQEATISRSLTLKEMQCLANIQLDPESTEWQYLNLFLLSFCLIGINFSDLLTLKVENIIEDRLVFKRRKTGKIYSIKLHPEAKKRLLIKPILDRKPTDYLLNYLPAGLSPKQLKDRIAQIIKNTNFNLNKITSETIINKNITTYYARYSWSNIAKSSNFSKDLIAEALGHEFGNKVTGIYLDQYENKVIDQMNWKVINKVFK